MRRTKTPTGIPADSPNGRSNIGRSALVGVVAGLTIGGGVALVAGLPSGLGATGAVGIAAQTDDDRGADSEGGPAGHAAGHAAEHEARLRAALAPLVEDGTLTDAQVDAVVEALAEAAPMRPDGDRRHQGPEMGRRGRDLKEVADLLGLTRRELRAELRSGRSLADIAVANGSSAQTVVDVLVADLKAHLDDEVAAGEHTQEEADQKLAMAEERITALVNGETPPPGGHGSRMDGDRGGHPGGPGHGPGPGSPGVPPAPSQDSESSVTD